MSADHNEQRKSRETKKFNLKINKANLTNVWDNRFFNVFVNGTHIFNFPASTDYFSLKDNTIYLRVLATSNIFRINGNFEEIAFKISNDDIEVQTKFKIKNVEIFELKNVGISVPIIGMRFNLA